jgi:LuxR family maltose regulon positive regulatory protein
VFVSFRGHTGKRVTYSHRRHSGAASRHSEVRCVVELQVAERATCVGLIEPDLHCGCMALVGQHDPLLATKLFVPRPAAGFVPRPHLAERLNAGLSGGLTLVCAPAGYGKTALVADWARQRLVAWLSLDRADNDPTRFWRHVLAALDGVCPGTAEMVEPVLGPPPPTSFEGPVAALINELASRSDSREIVLVLDDYHVIDSTVIHDSLTFLIEHRPPQLRLIVLSRADPPLPTARVRAAGELAEVRADDLRFSVEETGVLLRTVLETSLSEPTVAALTARTEGWIAGLRLASLSLQGRPDPDGFVRAFSGSHRYILDYLTEEVLEQQPEVIRHFLFETSILDRLSGALCDAITGRTDGLAMLEAIDRANLFVVPLDQERQWWRYHHLFVDLLRARLGRQWPDRVPQLHRKAASWYERRGLVEEAIGHALTAGDADWAARLFERQLDALLLRNEEATLQHWLAALPATVVASRPRLLVAQADMALSHGRFEAVERALDDAERAWSSTSDEAYEPSVGTPASLVANVPAAVAFWRAYVAELRGNADAAAAFDRRALAELGEEESLLASAVRLHLRTTELGLGELRNAEGDVRAAIAAFETAGQVYLALRGIEMLGHIQRAQGHLGSALETYRWGLEMALASGRLPPPSTGIAYAGLAEVAYQCGQLDVAFEHATEALALCRRLAYHRPFAAALAILARVRWAEGDPGGALDILAQDPPVATSLGVTGLLNPIPPLRARLSLACGNLVAARRWVQDRGLGPDDEVSYPREPEYLLLARLLLADGQPERAVALLERLHVTADRQGRAGNRLEIDALLSVTLDAVGDDARALAILSGALALAQPEGYVRIFVDEGAAMRALLVRLVGAHRADEAWAHRVPLEYLGQLLRTFEPEHGTAEAPASRRGLSRPGLIEALSGRELEVLQLLAAGKSNQDIGVELSVALDTVKKHVSHILAKLGATNRTEATARARVLGLLAEGGRG